MAYRFFPSHGHNHRQYSFCLPTEGWPGWAGPGSLVEYEQWPISVLTRLKVAQLCWCDHRCYCWTKPSA